MFETQYIVKNMSKYSHRRYAERGHVHRVNRLLFIRINSTGCLGERSFQIMNAWKSAAAAEAYDDD